MSEQIIKVTPAFDKSHPDPEKNYGIGAVRFWFYLKGELAIVQFQLATSWYLPGTNKVMLSLPYEVPETDPEVLKRMRSLGGLFGPHPETRKVVLCDYYSVRDAEGPQGWDVGYHSPVALYTDQQPAECDMMPSGKCFYDGSSLRATEWAKKFVEGGTDWLWPTMERELKEIEERVKEQMKDAGRFS